MQMVELSENVVLYLMGEGEDGWQSLLGTHFFVSFINLCHSESALITIGTIIVICRQALILLMISLCNIII